MGKKSNRESFFDVIERNMKQVPGFMALIKLILFGGFLIFFVLVVRLGSNPNPKNNGGSATTTVPTTTKVQEEKTYKDFLEDVYKENKRIQISITYKLQSYKIDMNSASGVLTGSIESVYKTSKFKIENNEVYEVKMDSESINPSILEGISIEYIIPANLIATLNNNKAIKVLSEDSVKYNYEFEGKTAVVEVKDDKVTSIELTEGEDTYSFIIE